MSYDPTRIQSDCRGKAKHSPNRAKQIARDMRRRHGERVIQAYACKFCGGWHVGSGNGSLKKQANDMQKTYGWRKQDGNEA
jgi:hypothetical protein